MTTQRPLHRKILCGGCFQPRTSLSWPFFAASYLSSARPGIQLRFVRPLIDGAAYHLGVHDRPNSVLWAKSVYPLTAHGAKMLILSDWKDGRNNNTKKILKKKKIKTHAQQRHEAISNSDWSPVLGDFFGGDGQLFPVHPMSSGSERKRKEKRRKPMTVQIFRSREYDLRHTRLRRFRVLRSIWHPPPRKRV